MRQDGGDGPFVRCKCFYLCLLLSGEYCKASEFENVNITAVRSFLYYKSDDK